MSKSNVNPNHYKVAGRERQGEDIAQIRNKQKHAESLARMRFEPRTTPQAPPLADEAPQTEPPPAARKSVTRKQAPTPAKPRKRSPGTVARPKVTAAKAVRSTSAKRVPARKAVVQKKTTASGARSSGTSRTSRRPATKARQR